MKKVLLTVCMLALSLAAAAQNGNAESSIIENGDETVFISPKKVTVKKGSATSIRIDGENNGAEYTYSITTEGNEGDTRTVHKETDANWNFTIPFANIKEEQEARGNFFIDPTFGFGLLSATEAGTGVDLPFGNASFEYALDNIVGLSYKTTRNSNIGVTFGLNWRNYRMIGNNRFMKDGDRILITGYPEGADIDYSRIRTFDITLSFMYGYRFNRYVSMRVGPVVNFNTNGHIKTRYSLGGESFKEKQKNINIAPVTVDLKAELNFRFIGLYFKYSPCNVLNTDFGPEFKSMSVGLLFGV